jgi:uncharacterized protein (DUF4415 family)
MANRKPLIDTNGEVRELTEKDFAGAKPFSSLPESLRRKIGQRGPQKAPTKERTTIRLSPEVLHTFRATGAGWQTRVDDALKDWLRMHSLTR